MQKGDFANLSELQAVWPHADLVRAEENVPVIVFNIGGNNYRVVIINWTYRSVYIQRIMNYKDYDLWNKRGRPL